MAVDTTSAAYKARQAQFTQQFGGAPVPSVPAPVPTLPSSYYYNQGKTPPAPTTPVVAPTPSQPAPAYTLDQASQTFKPAPIPTITAATDTAGRMLNLDRYASQAGVTPAMTMEWGLQGKTPGTPEYNDVINWFNSKTKGGAAATKSPSSGVTQPATQTTTQPAGQMDVGVIQSTLQSLRASNPAMSTEQVVNMAKDKLGYHPADDAVYNGFYQSDKPATAGTAETTAGTQGTETDLATMAGQANLSLDDFLKAAGVSAGVTPEETKQIQDALGLTGLAQDVFKKPEKTTQEMYNSLYAQYGLDKLKTQYDDLSKQRQDLAKNLASLTGSITDNPWLSEVQGMGKINKATEQFRILDASLNSRISDIKDMYDKNLEGINSAISRSTADFTANQELNKSKLDYLSKQAEAQVGYLKESKLKGVYAKMPEYLKAKSLAEQQKLAFQAKPTLSKQGVVSWVDGKWVVSKGANTGGKEEKSSIGTKYDAIIKRQIATGRDLNTLIGGDFINKISDKQTESSAIINRILQLYNEDLLNPGPRINTTYSDTSDNPSD